VPALHVAGWWDVFLSGSIANFAGLSALGGAAQKLLVGPWYHCPWTPLDPTGPSGQVIDDWQLRWLDHFMKGRETGVLDAPATVWVEREGWRDLDGWPPSSSRPVDWFLHSGGRANSAFGDGTLSPEPPGDEPADVFVYDPSFPAPSRGGHSCCFEDAPMGPAAQNATEALGTVLVYTSAPLKRDLVLVGDASVTLHAASSARDTDFTARLCTVAPDGRSTNVQEGIIRARFRDSLAEPKLLRPGEVYEYRIPLGPLGLSVPAGNRLRLDVSSSDFPQWDRNLNTGGKLGTEGASAAVTATQVVLHDRARPSRLTLPVAS
jgi:putative CocE/NonD family hydrolase